MLSKEAMVKVTNRNNGSVGYTIPDLGNLRREFQSGETKEITAEELRKLSYIPGGQVILDKYLMIENAEMVDELLGDVEPEYNYTDEDVKNLLLTGSLAELEDCLDFAPAGVINLIKKYAVELKLNDIQKREAILKSTGFNVTSAIYVNEETADENVTEEKTRRVTTATTTSTTPGRRTEPKYKNVVLK